MARTGERVEEVALWCGTLFAVGTAFGIPVWQGLQWLRLGFFPPVATLADYLGEPHFRWVGAQRLVAWFLHWPLYFSGPIVGLAVVWMGHMIASDMRANEESS